MPGLEGFSLAFLADGHTTVVPFKAEVQPQFFVELPSLGVALRFPAGLLRPVIREGDKWVETKDENGKLKPAELRFDVIGLRGDLDGNIEVLPGAPTGTLGAVLIGDTGMVLEIDGITLCLSRKQFLLPVRRRDFVE